MSTRHFALAHGTWGILHELLLYPYNLQRRLTTTGYFPARTANPLLSLQLEEATFGRDAITNFHNQHMWRDINPRTTVYQGRSASI